MNKSINIVLAIIFLSLEILGISLLFWGPPFIELCIPVIMLSGAVVALGIKSKTTN